MSQSIMTSSFVSVLIIIIVSHTEKAVVNEALTGCTPFS